LVIDKPNILIIIGEISEFIAIAGSVDNIPAINIHSPCLRVVLRPKYSFDVDHQANTGVENPIIHAGKAIIKNNKIAAGVNPRTNKGAMNIAEIIVPMMKIIQR
jgi:hypothetical protein